MARLRASQTQERREAVHEMAQLAMRNNRAYPTDQERNSLQRTNASSDDFNQAAFLYDCTIDYSSHSFVLVSPTAVVYEHCGALKFAGETPGLSCLNGKIKLPLLTPPPEQLHTLIHGETPESRHFLVNIQKYNDCFQMTSFVADIIEQHRFNPTFKIQGQIHHRIGSLQPLVDAQHKFLQYFIENTEEQLERRQEINRAMKRAILQALQQLLHEDHAFGDGRAIQDGVRVHIK